MSVQSLLSHSGLAAKVRLKSHKCCTALKDIYLFTVVFNTQTKYAGQRNGATAVNIYLKTTLGLLCTVLEPQTEGH